MPVYEFRCSTCHAVFDGRRPVADADTPGQRLRQRLRVLLSAPT